MGTQTKRLMTWKEHETQWAPVGVEAAKLAVKQQEEKKKLKPKLVCVMKHNFEEGKTEVIVDGSRFVKP